MLGDHADEALQDFSVAINLGLTLSKLNKAMPIHPTFAEELLLIFDVLNQ